MFFSNADRARRGVHGHQDDQPGMEPFTETYSKEDAEALLHPALSRTGVLQDGVREDTRTAEERTMAHTRDTQETDTVVSSETGEEVEPVQTS